MVGEGKNCCEAPLYLVAVTLRVSG